jgi:hypothetical protein
MNDYQTESSQSAYYEECGVLIFKIGNFIDDLQSFIASSMCTDPVLFGHPVLNLPALSHRGISEWMLSNNHLYSPLKKEFAGGESHFPISGSI